MYILVKKIICLCLKQARLYNVDNFNILLNEFLRHKDKLRQNKFDHFCFLIESQLNRLSYLNHKRNIYYSENIIYQIINEVIKNHFDINKIFNNFLIENNVLYQFAFDYTHQKYKVNINKLYINNYTVCMLSLYETAIPLHSLNLKWQEKLFNLITK